MQRIKNRREIALTVLTLLFAAVFSFALIRVIPSRAETAYTTHTQENGLQIGVSDGGWTLDNEEKPNKYTAVANDTTAPTLKITVEGEQYISFEYQMKHQLFLNSYSY